MQRGESTKALVGCHFRALRDAAGMDVTSFLGLTGLTKGTVQRIEDGTGAGWGPTVTYLKALIEIVDANRVIPGKVIDWLEVPFGTWVPNESSPSALLNPELCVVGFHGTDRKSQLARLKSWCDNDEPLGIESFSAEAGMGKTRLGIELCLKIQKEEIAHERQQWKVGFLVPDLFPQKSTSPWEGLDISGKSVLLIVDYAGHKKELEVLKRLLPFVQPGHHSLKRLRILLLDRTDFWLSEIRADKACAPILRLNAFRRQFARSQLDSAVDGNDRQSVFKHAAAAFSNRINPKAIPAEVQGLDAPEFDRLLMIHMLALLSIEPGARSNWKEKDILESHLYRERRMWERGLRVREMDISLLPVVEKVYWTISTHEGAPTAEEALKLVENVRGFKRLADHIQDAILDILHRCYASSQAYIQPLRPDYLGEFFIAKPPTSGAAN